VGMGSPDSNEAENQNQAQFFYPTDHSFFLIFIMLRAKRSSGNGRFWFRPRPQRR
jgi:hypothetical protein